MPDAYKSIKSSSTGLELLHLTTNQQKVSCTVTSRQVPHGTNTITAKNGRLQHNIIFLLIAIVKRKKIFAPVSWKKSQILMHAKTQSYTLDTIARNSFRSYFY